MEPAATGVKSSIKRRSGRVAAHRLYQQEKWHLKTPIMLTVDYLEFGGELLDTAAAQALASRMPLELFMNRWGRELHGDIGTPMGKLPGPKQEVMAVGDLAFWEPGNAVCLFWGPTPASRSTEPRVAGEAHLIGRVTGDFVGLSHLGDNIRASLKITI
jgi:hypothetical protein